MSIYSTSASTNVCLRNRNYETKANECNLILYSTEDKLILIERLLRILFYQNDKIKVQYLKMSSSSSSSLSYQSPSPSPYTAVA